MQITTTCRDCGGPLTLTHYLDTATTHPGCTPKPTRIEQLTQAWLDAALANDIGAEETIQKELDALHNRPPRMLDAALQYAAWGWPVFPCHTASKKPATRNGFKNATTDPDRIRAWWTANPSHNIGLPTGHAFDVIDIDTPDGIPTNTALIDADIDVHGQVCTSKGGYHYYITPQGRGNSARSAPGCDYRGAGGYVLAPPSTCGPGQAWSWIHHPSPAIRRQP